MWMVVCVDGSLYAVCFVDGSLYAHLTEFGQVWKILAGHCGP